MPNVRTKADAGGVPLTIFESRNRSSSAPSTSKRRELRAPSLPGRLQQIREERKCVGRVPDLRVNIHLDTGAFEAFFGLRAAEVNIVVALSRAESQGSSGENVRRKTQAGAHPNFGPAPEIHQLRLIAFLEELQQGRLEICCRSLRTRSIQSRRRVNGCSSVLSTIARLSSSRAVRSICPLVQAAPDRALGQGRAVRCQQR